MSVVLKVLSAGLPDSAMTILKQAVSIAFNGAAEIEDLNPANLRRMVRLGGSDPGVVLVVLDKESSDKCADIENGLYSSGKYLS